VFVTVVETGANVDDAYANVGKVDEPYVNVEKVEEAYGLPKSPSDEVLVQSVDVPVERRICPFVPRARTES
jgi:hypothetical protein